MRCKKLREKGKGKINYTIWSDVFICSYCDNEHIFWEEALDSKEGKVFDKYPCPHCKAEISKSNCKRKTKSIFDKSLDKDIEQAVQIPVLINYSVRIKQKGKWKTIRLNKTPDSKDIELIQKIDDSQIPYWFPTNELVVGYNTEQPKRSHGIANVHQFYTKRNLWVLATFFDRIGKISNQEIRYRTMFGFTAMQRAVSKLASIAFTYFFHGGGGAINAGTKGTYYISSAIPEVSIFESFSSRLRSIKFDVTQKKEHRVITSVESATNLTIKNNSIDYIFTDPPFGANLMYSELNFIWESWLKVLTNTNSEAIMNRTQQKDLPEYSNLMLHSFKEYYRVLKPKRWITVEFHNSKSSVWNAIQDAMMQAGFIIVQVSVLDKKQGSFKQYTTAGAVEKDLVISAYKPSESFASKFLKQGGHQMEAEFINQFLDKLRPIPMIERSEKMLYSKMLAFYIQHGYEVRYDAKTFYKMLSDNFTSEDGLWFNANQINSYIEYKKRMQLEGIEDLKTGAAYFLFVSDEKTSLAWLYVYLQTPKTFSDISNAYKIAAQIQGDNVPEIRELVEDNFIQEHGIYRLPKTEQEITEKSEKREKALMREFETLLIQAKTEKGRIKTVRKEALSYGFEVCYKNQRYEDILMLSKKLEKNILENDSDLRTMVEAAEMNIEGF